MKIGGLNPSFKTNDLCIIYLLGNYNRQMNVTFIRNKLCIKYLFLEVIIAR